MKVLDPLVKKYILLAHRLERHHRGVVDAHYGFASEVKLQVESEPIVSLNALHSSAEFILGELESNQEPRARYLYKQTLALKTIIEKKLGADITYRDEARLMLGIETISKQEEAPLHEAMDELDALLEGSGLLTERYTAWRRKFELRGEEVMKFTNAAMEQMKEKSHSLFPLPENSISVSLVRNKPWTGYHWYKGNFTSLYELNVDVPTTIWGVLHTTTHEAFCGHHTEAIIREQELVNQCGYVEFTLNILGAPCSLLSEGLAEAAAEIVIGNDEAVAQWLQENELLHKRPFTERDGKILAAIEKLGRKAVINAALLMHEENATDQAVVNYLAEFSPNDEVMLRRTVARLRDADYRTYMLTYPIGKELVLQKINASASSPQEAFFNLCRSVDVSFDSADTRSAYAFK
ncbi:MAG: hypothetical protein SFU91_13730 [Chloroherpetonaceae bacterium]|nr:hypothetical protein [Chloroherpetonaceae bacterium]